MLLAATAVCFQAVGLGEWKINLKCRKCIPAVPIKSLPLTQTPYPASLILIATSNIQTDSLGKGGKSLKLLPAREYDLSCGARWVGTIR